MQTRVSVICRPEIAVSVQEAIVNAGAQYIEQLTHNITGDKVFVCVGDPMIAAVAMSAGASSAVFTLGAGASPEVFM